MKYLSLFSEIKLGNRTVKNRVVYSPTGENLAYSSGEASERMRAYYTERAKGGAGIIMLGAAAIAPEGRSHSNALLVDQPRNIGGLMRIARGIHAYDALLLVQLQHAGARTSSPILDGMLPRCVSDTDPETASIAELRKKGPQKELTLEEIKALPVLYVQAARNCQSAEADGVEIHMAHSFLLNQFLSPDTNKRRDEYGGCLENRMRLPLEIVRAVREACGPDFIIGARIPRAEYVKNGLTAEEIRTIAMELEKAGCDVLSVSVGMTVDQTKIREPSGAPQGARLSKIANVKNAVTIPVMGSGTFREPEFCDRVIAEGKQDFILIARQFICDPHWAKKAMEGRSQEIRPCLTCNAACFDSVPLSHPIGCVLNPVTGNEFDRIEEQKAAISRKVMIIGGGLAGMQAAITSARRGHKVNLYEKSEKLGGQMHLACVPPGKDAILKAALWFAEETRRAGVTIHTGRSVSLEDIKKEAPDKILVASGATPWAPPFPGKEFAVQSWELLNGSLPLPKGMQIAVIGGGLVGCETALFLQQAGNQLTIIEMMQEAASGLESANREHLLRELAEGGTTLCTGTKVLSIEAHQVICEKDGDRLEFKSDLTVLAIGSRPYGTDIAEEIRKAGYDVSLIGDAASPATFAAATKSGYLAASVI